MALASDGKLTLAFPNLSTDPVPTDIYWQPEWYERVGGHFFPDVAPSCEWARNPESGRFRRKRNTNFRPQDNHYTRSGWPGTVVLQCV